MMRQLLIGCSMLYDFYLHKCSNPSIVNRTQIQVWGYVNLSISLNPNFISDQECGVRVNDSELRFQPGDVILAVETRMENDTCKWDPGF